MPAIMFEAVCQKMIQSMGKKTLHATPSLDEKENVKLFQVVKNTGKRFKRPVFKPTIFELRDILDGKENLDVDLIETKLVDLYESTSELSVEANIGAQANVTSASIDAKHKSNAKFTFGIVEKKKLNTQKLIEELQKRKIDRDKFNMMGEIAKEKSLFMITGVVSLPDGAEVQEVKETGFAAKADAKFQPVAVGGGAGFALTKGDRFRLTKNTAMAFNVQKLSINRKTGDITLAM